MKRRRRGQAGLTILEMLIVVMIVGLVAGVTFPSVAAGLQSLKMRSASDAVASFLTAAMGRAERTEQPVELVFHLHGGRLEMRTVEAAASRDLKLDEEISIAAVLPAVPGAGEEMMRSVVLLPGGVFPRLTVELLSRRGQRRWVRIDPLTRMAVVQMAPESVSTGEK